MNTIIVKRPPRKAGPAQPEGRENMAEPPVLAEPAGRDFTSLLMILPMGCGSLAFVLMLALPSHGSPATYLLYGMMGVAMMSMGLVMVGRQASERRRKMRAERRDYLRYLGQTRARARASADEQRAAARWNNPDASRLWSIAAGPRLWERRPSHDDFARVRIGVGVQHSGLELVPPTTKPIEDLEPLSAISLRRLSRAFRTVSGIPIAVGLRSFTSIEFAGQARSALDLVRAMIAQLVTFHSPDELRLAVLCGSSGQVEWDWVKWLPHNAHLDAYDRAGALRQFAADHDLLLEMLGPTVADRGPHDKTATPSSAEPFVVIVAYLAEIPPSSRLLDEGIRNTVLLDLTGAMAGGPKVLRLTCREDRVEYPSSDDDIGSAEPDHLSLVQVDTLARIIAPMRTSGTVDLVDEPLESDFGLTALLGIRDPYSFDVGALWRPRVALRARLNVPIGVSADGEVVELDLKEAAQGGMGPHGMLIGATGSGKSELLRTLVIGLAATHSSEVLNFVLVDYKGGATFLGMDRLPHTSALITNLADELPLVDRMLDAVNGEVVRRQELLRRSGHPSQLEYERARLAGADLEPLPTLFFVVDEFSELLASKPDFMDLFVMIGRVGRSLAVHLLLASQRLDEGRIHRVEGHLSYRIALKTFSSMESRSVIGVAKAYELPSAPGNGYLKIDTTNLVRFKAAYVSGPTPRTAVTGDFGDELGAAIEVAPFDTQLYPHVPRQPAPSQSAKDDPDADERDETGDHPDAPASDAPKLIEVLIDRLAGAGPPARQIWLPPLAASPTLDALLPVIVPHPERGMTADGYDGCGRLRIPVGVVDKAFEQARELLIADLSGADGHVGVAGAPQTGKSTLLRTLILALALTHTPEEVQFYCLDFGGGGMQTIAGLPHVGSIATRMDPDRVVRTVEEIAQLLERRESTFTQRAIDSMTTYRAMRARGDIDDPYGDVFLVVDGWFTVKQDFSDIENRLSELASRGLSYGVHLVVAAARWSEIRPWLRDLIGTRFELRLGDAMESEVGSRKAATVPATPGRGLTRDGYHFLSALPRLDGRGETTDLANQTRTIVEEMNVFWSGRRAPGVRLLPTRLPVTDLPPAEGDLRVCLGWDEQRLQPVWHDFSVTPHLMVFGDGETGKTNLLHLVIHAVMQRYGPDRAKILLGDARRGLDAAVPDDYRVGYAITSDVLRDLCGKASVSLTKRMPGPDISPDRLAARDWWQGPELFVVIDDYDLFASGGVGAANVIDPLIPILAHGVHIGLHLIIARSTSGAMRAMMDPVLRRLWELGGPALLLSYPKEEGKFLGEAAAAEVARGPSAAGHAPRRVAHPDRSRVPGTERHGREQGGSSMTLTNTRAADLCRISVVGPDGWADLAVPLSTTISALLPVLVRYTVANATRADATWVLQRLGGLPLDPDADTRHTRSARRRTALSATA